MGGCRHRPHLRPRTHPLAPPRWHILANSEATSHSLENIVNKEIVVPSGVRVRSSGPRCCNFCSLSRPSMHTFIPIQRHFRPRTIIYKCSLDDWKKVRFSYEVHFEPEPQRKLHIVSKPGVRLCQDSIEEQLQPEEKDKNQKRMEKILGLDGFNARALTLE